MNDKYIYHIINAIDRLENTFGHPIVFGREKDWGQVIARMCLGEDWNVDIPNLEKGPTFDAVIAYTKLEKGDWPDWLLGSTRCHCITEHCFHLSDCGVHDAPAYVKEPCNCQK